MGEVRKRRKTITPAVPFSRCVAKSRMDGGAGMSVQEHCLVVGEVARRLASQLPSRFDGDLPFPAYLPALLHDIGKACPGFQLKYFREHIRTLSAELAQQNTQGFMTDHAAVGAAAVNRTLGKRTQLSSLATIVALHHGAIRCKYLSDNIETCGGMKWTQEREQLIQALVDHDQWPYDADLTPVQLAVVAGVLCVADWIGSDETLFPAEGLPEGVDLEVTAQRAIELCGLNRVAVRPGMSFEDVFPFSPHEFQTAVESVIRSPGLYIVEAPMGTGKTEAALFAAYQLMVGGECTGIFFGLPTRLTSDRIHERVQGFLDRICEQEQDAKLAHGTAWLKEYEVGGAALRPGNAWFNPRKRRLMHPFVVGTIDQALLSVLRVKHFFVRTFALAGKVVILDEVHSYDVYTSRLIDILVQQLLEAGCTVIILSATLSPERRASLLRASPGHGGSAEAYPLITGIGSSDSDRSARVFSAPPPPDQTYRVTMAAWDDAAVAQQAVAKAEQGHCVLCIANTVARAQAWMRAVQGRRKGDDALPVGLLHSKFPAYQREEIEAEWLTLLGKGDVHRPDGCVLVATQVVEQSVDIDADVLITEIAPTDMLLQRMGRQWRHSRSGRPSAMPETTIVCGVPGQDADIDEIVTAFGKTNCLVYAPYMLWKTWAAWCTRDEVSLPSDIRELIRLTYARNDEEESPAVRLLFDELEQSAKKLGNRAIAALASIESMPVSEDSERAATRYSDLPTTQVLLVRELNSIGRIADLTLLDGSAIRVNADVPDLAATRKLHGHVLNLATHWLRAGNVSLDKPAWLEKHFFEVTVPLVWDGETGALCTRDGEATGLRYTPCMGLMREVAADAQTTSAPLDEYDGIDVFDKQRCDW